MNWTQSVIGSQRDKQRFHSQAKTRLRALARELGLEKGSYDLRSNMAGPAVSGEITLHHERVYIQVSQSLMGPQSSILIRSCEGRRDYVGGPNNFAHINMLDNLGDLADRVRSVVPALSEAPRP